MPAATNVNACLPEWATRFETVPQTVVHSGCPTNTGRVQCEPETMRANAEKKLIQSGHWTGHLPLAAYTLARHMRSEHGSGSVVERMGLAVSTIQRAHDWYDGDPNKLLVYHKPMKTAKLPSYGYYGPIHLHGEECAANGIALDASGKRCSPFGRWAATTKDPTIQDILIAAFALTGQATSYFRGANDQLGAKYFSPSGMIQSVQRRARESNSYWVGHLPGVNPMEVFFYATRKDIDSESPLGKLLVANAIALFQDPRTLAWLKNDNLTDVPWGLSNLPCAKESSAKSKTQSMTGLPMFISVAILSSVGIFYVYKRRQRMIAVPA